MDATTKAAADFAPHGQRLDGPPTAPGWYIARMKSWSVHDGWAVVKVTQCGTDDPLQVWQAADERPWPVEAWDWKARLRL